jgi:sporulation protein YlmC with PRC-barrel domain
VSDANFPHEMLAGLQLLDRQLVDPDGFLAGKVDDLELEFDDEGVPTVVAVLSGPGALAGRVGGRIGRWIAVVYRRLQDEPDSGPARVPFELVTSIGTDVTLAARRSELESNRSEDWARDVIVSKLPGARHEAE